MDEKLNILAISYLYPNRVYPDHGIFVHNRIKAVSKHCRVHVINPIPWFPLCRFFHRYRDYHRIPKFDIRDGVPVHHPRFFIVPRYFKFLDAITFALAVLFTVRFQGKKHGMLGADHVDLHWTYPDVVSGFLLSRWLKRPFLVTLRGREALNLHVHPQRKNVEAEERSLRHVITRYFLKKAALVIGLSQELVDLAVGMGVLPQRTCVIPNGVDTQAFHYIPKDRARKTLGINEDERFILVVGSLIYRKGIDRVLKALPDIHGRVSPDITLRVIGSQGPDGYYKKELEQLAQNLGVRDRVVFQGQVPNGDLVTWYNAADVFCLPSRGEGCPNVVSEAMACGCPCVATRVGAIPDMIQKERQGKLVGQGNGDLGRCLVEVLENEYHRRENAREMKDNNWDRCAHRVLSAYGAVGEA